MARLDLDIYGVTARLTGDPDAVDILGVHFSAYRRANRADSEVDVRVELTRGEPQLDVEGRVVADQVVDRGIVYNRGPVTWIDHHGYASSRYDFDSESGQVRALQADDLVELGYLMVHSRLGRLLETKRHLYRLHCLGASVKDQGVLVLAPSGGGKSTLALALLSCTDVRLLGDDMVLIDRAGRVYPFHSPLGVSAPEAARDLGRVIPFSRRLHPPKWLLTLDSLEDRLATDPVFARYVLLGRRVSRPPSVIVPTARRHVASALWRDIVVGLGLPQVLELVARHGAGDLVGLAPTALRRSRAALRLCFSARGGLLELADPDEAARAIARELHGT